jgi:hypothetical protein
LTTPGAELARTFPLPNPDVGFHLSELQRLAAIEAPTELELRRLAALARPWDPPNCPPELRRHVYSWLDEVVAWINEDHTWRVDRVVPACWPQHPHIVHELATVACLRWSAGCTASATPLEEWHRVTLPLFLERIAQRVGPNACPPGRHQPHPGAGRSQLYREEPATGDRRRRRARDASLGVLAEPSE